MTTIQSIEVDVSTLHKLVLEDSERSYEHSSSVDLLDVLLDMTSRYAGKKAAVRITIVEN